MTSTWKTTTVQDVREHHSMTGELTRAWTKFRARRSVSILQMQEVPDSMWRAFGVFP